MLPFGVVELVEGELPQAAAVRTMPMTAASSAERGFQFIRLSPCTGGTRTRTPNDCSFFHLGRLLGDAPARWRPQPPEAPGYQEPLHGGESEPGREGGQGDQDGSRHPLGVILRAQPGG